MVLRWAGQESGGSGKHSACALGRGANQGFCFRTKQSGSGEVAAWSPPKVSSGTEDSMGGGLRSMCKIGWYMFLGLGPDKMSWTKPHPVEPLAKSMGPQGRPEASTFSGQQDSKTSR